MILKRARVNDLMCVSQSGTLMRMKAEEFFKRMQQVDDTWDEILRAYYIKVQKMDERFKMITSIFDIKPRDIISDFLNE